MHLPRVLRTASFRLAATYTCLFAGSVAVLGAFVLWTTRSALEQQMTSRIEAEAALLEAEFRSGGVDQLVAAVHERSRGAHALDYRVQDPGGRQVAGDLPAAETGWSEVSTTGRSPGETDDSERVRVLARRLPDGTLLAVGEDTGRIEEATEAISFALWWALGLTLALGIAGGLVLSSGFLRRVDGIARTAEAIVDGDFEKRIPERGTQDDLDRLARTLNRMLDRIGELMIGMRQVSNAAAHELRTPLARLRQQLETALAESQPASGVQFAIQRAIAEMDGILDTFTALCLWRRRDPDGQGLSGACAALPPRRRCPGAADWNVSGLPRRALVHRRAGGSCRGTVRADRGGEHPASGGSDRRRRVEIAQASGRKPNRFVSAGGQPI